MGFIIGIGITLVGYIICMVLKKSKVLNKHDDFEENNHLGISVNSAVFAYLYHGYATEKAVKSLILYLANKGYIRVEELKEMKYKMLPVYVYVHKLILVKPYEGEDRLEKLFLETLFEGKMEIDMNEQWSKGYQEKIKELKKVLVDQEGYRLKEAKNVYKLTTIAIGVTAFVVIHTLVYMMLYGKVVQAVIMIEPVIFFIVSARIIVRMLNWCAEIRRKERYNNRDTSAAQKYAYYIMNGGKDDISIRGCNYFYEFLPYAVGADLISYTYIKRIKDEIKQVPTWFIPYDNANSIKGFKKYLVSNWITIKEDERPDRFQDSDYTEIY